MVRDRGDSIYTALESPDHLLVVAAGGPAGGFGAVIPPWLGHKSQSGDGGDRRLRRLRAAESLSCSLHRTEADMTLRVFDPTQRDEAPPVSVRPRAWRSLQGKTVGFISNGKEGTKGYLRCSSAGCCATNSASPRWSGAPKLTTARRRKRPSSTRRDSGTPRSPVSGIEGAAHRAVCTTPFRLNGKASRPSA